MAGIGVSLINLEQLAARQIILFKNHHFYTICCYFPIGFFYSFDCFYCYFVKYIISLDKFINHKPNPFATKSNNLPVD